jgi:hypothetical protein
MLIPLFGVLSSFLVCIELCLKKSGRISKLLIFAWWGTTGLNCYRFGDGITGSNGWVLWMLMRD